LVRSIRQYVVAIPTMWQDISLKFPPIFGTFGKIQG
jgi:hypothetical protein